MAFSPPIVGCLAKKRLAKGGSRAPQDPPGYAYESVRFHSCLMISLDRSKGKLVSRMRGHLVTVTCSLFSSILDKCL